MHSMMSRAAEFQRSGQHRDREWVAGRVMRGIAACGVMLGFASGAWAQVVERSYDVPTLDRWMYPFNGTPGTRIEASTFATPLEELRFDHHDAQFLLGFDTEDAWPAGLGVEDYHVFEARIYVTVLNDDVIRYDPTYDSYRTYLDSGDPDYVPDDTPGRPIKLYKAGYRNGFDVHSFQETSPFGPSPLGIEMRNVYAAMTSPDGQRIDVSNNVRKGFEAEPMAVAETDTLSPGEFIPANTELVFELDLCDEATRAYFAEALDAGRLNVVITSLHPAEELPGGGGEGDYPRFYTKENPSAIPQGRTARLEIRALSGNRAAVSTGFSEPDITDFFAFLDAFAAGDPVADVNNDCEIDVTDFFEYLSLFEGN